MPSEIGCKERFYCVPQHNCRKLVTTSLIANDIGQSIKCFSTIAYVTGKYYVSLL